MNVHSALGARPVTAFVTAAALALGVGTSACSSDREAVSAPPFGTVAVPAVTVPPLASPLSTPAVPVDSVAMVGDSITVGSQLALEEGLGALGIDDVVIDAANGRRMLVDGSVGSGLDAVEEIAAADPPDVWVIALGTNDVGNYPVEAYGAAIAELLAAVPPDAPLIWVDTHLTDRSEESAAFNDVLRETLAARDLTTVVEWSAVAGADGILDDGIHPSERGTEEFRDRVVAAVDAWSA